MVVVAKSLKYSKHGDPDKVLEITEDKIDSPKDNQVLVKILAAPINPSDVLSVQGVYPIDNMVVVAKSLKYSKHGDPDKVLEITEDKIDSPKDNQVLVKILAAPINPSDVLSVQGVYPVRPKFPAIGGNECVAEVVACGNKVQKLRVGQHVVPIAMGLGTWTTHKLYTEDQLLPISNEIDLANAATILVNPCTAYRMLKDFVKLGPGDCVIQNGANSAVGQAVHQLCKIWNIQSIGIVRKRPDIESLKGFLKGLGATEVLTEEELSTTKIFEDGTIKKPKLAFDCVGGKSATELTRHLDYKGNLIIYGSMSREPVAASATDFIFKDLTFHGYWLQPWIKELPNSAEHKETFNDLCKLMKEGKFLAPEHELVPLDQFKEAVINLSKGYAGKKYILTMGSKS